MHQQRIEQFKRIIQCKCGSRGEIGARGLANIAYSLARSSMRQSLSKFLFTTLARSAECRLGEFNPQDLASTAWAFATAGQSEEKLFAALARATELQLSDFNPQDLANAA